MASMSLLVVLLVAAMALIQAHSNLKPRDPAPQFKAKAVIDDKVGFRFVTGHR